MASIPGVLAARPPARGTTIRRRPSEDVDRAPAACRASSWTATAAGRASAACPRPRVTRPASRRCGPSWSAPSSVASRCSPSTPSAARTGHAPARRWRCSSRCSMPPSATTPPTWSGRACAVRLAGPHVGAARSDPGVHRGGTGTQTAGGTRMTLNVAFNYSGRTEIVDAVRRCLRDGIPADVGRRVDHRAAPVHRGPARGGPAHPDRR